MKDLLVSTQPNYQHPLMRLTVFFFNFLFTPTLSSWHGPPLPTVCAQEKKHPISYHWHTHLPPALYPAFSSLVVLSMSPLFHILTLLSSLFPYLLWMWLLFPTVLIVPIVPKHCLSHPSCSYGNQRATMLGKHYYACTKRDISLLPAESCSRTDFLLDNFHMLQCNPLCSL